MTHILASAIIMLAAFALPGYTHPRPSIFNNLFTFFQLILELDKVWQRLCVIISPNFSQFMTVAAV